MESVSTFLRIHCLASRKLDQVVVGSNIVQNHSPDPMEVISGKDQVGVGSNIVPNQSHGPKEVQSSHYLPPNSHEKLQCD